jgi:GNAT superfamily N-acetyltransferase
MADDPAIRTLSAGDQDVICRHREAMFLEMGRDPKLVAAMSLPFRSWLEDRLAQKRYFGFVAEQDGRVVGGVGMMVIDWPPHPSHPLQNSRGYILNLYVDPDHRGKGLARRLMQAAEDQFARLGIDFMTLHASDAGRSVYASLGWQATTEMAKPT